MGFRLQRRIQLGKFIRLNISKSGVGVSTGFPGFRVSVGPRGSFLTLGLPGTGISYRKKLGGKSKRSQKKEETPPASAQAAPADPPEETQEPEPGFFASKEEKELAKGLDALQADEADEALDHFLAASDEPGAAILAAAILSKQAYQEYKAIQLLEPVVQSDEEFPTELMQKYLPDAHIDIEITPTLTASVSLDGLAAPLLLVELYQAERRVREAIALLEELEALAGEPALTLSLCELYASRNLWDNIIERAQGVEPEDDISLAIVIFYGRAMRQKGLAEAALTVFNKALRSKKDRDPQLLLAARYWRAIVYQEQGSIGRANKAFQRIFAEQPDFKDVAQRLDELAIGSR